nr:putative ribonuclease H-like domain-containing protein [Tanacetum cinerariifolium]
MNGWLEEDDDWEDDVEWLMAPVTPLTATLTIWSTYEDIRTGAIIGRGTEIKGLYYADEVTQNGAVMLSHETAEREAWLWHRRLGHPSNGYLHVLFPKLIITAVSYQLMLFGLMKDVVPLMLLGHKLVLLRVTYIFIDGWFESFTFTNYHILSLIIQTLPLISRFLSSPQIIMAPLTFADTHNMITFLTKSNASEGFDQIVDFLTAHTIQYALMVYPTIYVSFIKQFWASVSIKKSNDAVKLQALIDRKKVIITEDSIRQNF